MTLADLARFSTAVAASRSRVEVAARLESLRTISGKGSAARRQGVLERLFRCATGVRIYSRTGRDVTASLPEIVAAMGVTRARTLIVDGEVIALDARGRPHAFQETMRRFGRKLRVETTSAALPLTLFCFDCLHVDAPRFARVVRYRDDKTAADADTITTVRALAARQRGVAP